MKKYMFTFPNIISSLCFLRTFQAITRVIGIVWMLWFLLVANAGAQTVFGQKTDVAKSNPMLNLRMLTANDFGESYDPATGTLSLAYTDVSLPGNSHLKVEVRRKFSGNTIPSRFTGLFEIGDWSLDLPYIRGEFLKEYVEGQGQQYIRIYGNSGWSKGRECEGDVSDVVGRAWNDSGSSWPLSPSHYWTGKFLHIPQQVSENLIWGRGDFEGRQVTKANYIVTSCFRRADNNGEGIVVTGPDGTRYTFDYVVEKPNGMPMPVGNGGFMRYLMATKIEDKFGNTVNYNYLDGRLRSITASDGRLITFNYSGSYLDNVVANGRAWKYTYTTNATNNKLSDLDKVLLPDGKNWIFGKLNKYVYPAWAERWVSLSDTPGRCVPVSQGNLEQVIETPEKTKITYTFAITYHGIYDTKAYPYGDDPKWQAFRNANCSAYWSLIKKTVVGPGLPLQTWNYAYSQNGGNYYEGAGDGNRYGYGQLQNKRLTESWPKPVALNFPYTKPDSVKDALAIKTTTVTGPESKEIYYVDRTFDSPTQNMILAIDVADASTGKLLKREESYYQKGSMFADYCQLRAMPLPNIDHPYVCPITANLENYNYRINLNKKKTILYDAEGNATSYSAAIEDYDFYGFPALTSESNSYSARERYAQVNYIHDLNGWVLGLPKSTFVSEYASGPFTEVSRTDYVGKSVSGLYNNVQVADKVYSYGALYAYFKEYQSDGNIKRIEYANSNRWVEYSNYKRGQAQTISTPSSNSQIVQNAYKIIDDNGWLKKTTDPKGNVINYDYNPVGYLKDITHGNVFWSPSKIEYLIATGSEGITGVVAGMLQQRITRGNYRKNVYYDALLRPVLSSEEDLSNSATRRFIGRKFNTDNEVVFEYYPSAVAGSMVGISYTYDGLSRNTSVTRDTANGKVSSFTEYWSGNRIYAKDYKQNATTTTYLAYGQPEFSKPLTISSPEGVVTSLDYNIFGGLTSVSQGGLTQYNVYDSYQQRCKEVRADIGNTAFHYNITGEVDWFAQSTSVSGSATACDYDVDLADKVVQDYDNFGAIKTVSYADGTPAKSYTYDKNGNLESLVFGSLTQSYSYDDRNNLTGEKHSSDGQLRNLTYKFHAGSHLSEVVYPNGHSVTFAPNALGQASYVYNSTAGYYYAKNNTYHPSGTIDSYTYGNNLVYKLAQNTQQLPNSITLKNAANSMLGGFTYTYDNNSNIDRILDGQNSSFNVSMTYDGLDRLKTATGNWGGGVFNYDLLGNITSYNLGGFGLTYTYDNLSKRLASVTGSKIYSFSYDERSNVSRNTAAGVNMVYNLENQMISAGSTSYTYDGFNRRIKKQSVAGRELFMYSKAGMLMYSEKASGVKTNYIYLGKNLIAKDDSSTAQSSSSSSSSIPIANPTISSTIVSTAYSPWRVSVSGANFTSGSKITVFDSNGSQWASNISVVFTNASAVSFSLPTNLAPSKCNLTASCSIKFRLVVDSGSSVESNVTLPAVSAPISISGYSLNQSVSPWRVTLSGANFTSASKVTVFDNNGSQWASNIAINFTSASSINFALPANSPPSRCNNTTTCVIKARVINEYGVFSDVSISLPVLPVVLPPPAVTIAGVNTDYFPWAVWVNGANYLPSSTITVIDGNGSVWKTGISVAFHNSGHITFQLPSNSPPSGCNAAAACVIKLRVVNPDQRYGEYSLTLPAIPPAPTVSIAGVSTVFSPWAVWVNGANYQPSSTITVIDRNGSVWKTGISVAFHNAGHITFQLPSNSPPSECNALTTCVIKLRVVNPDQRYGEYSLTLPKR